ncbi:unnamed protein product, partial [Brassica oleracea]
IVYCVLTRVFHLTGIDYTEDLVTYNAADHKVEQALITLKKGFQLLIYGRKGKAKPCKSLSYRLDLDPELGFV